jgi:quinolinate synthase
MLENTEGAIKNGQYRETGNIVYTVRRKIKQKQNTICVGHHYTQTNVNKVNKTWTLLQTTSDKDEPNIVLMWKS